MTVTIRTHSLPAESQERRILTIPAGYTVMCRCIASKGEIAAEDCDGLIVLNDAEKQIASYRGRWYHGTGNPDGSVDIYSLSPTMASQ